MKAKIYEVYGAHITHDELRSNLRKFTTHNFGQYHAHGHIHSPNKSKSTRIEAKQYDVGVDANNYRPVSISKIEAWISNYNKDNNERKS
jgi:calcineurin-like phosphoesterase family protein